MTRKQGVTGLMCIVSHWGLWSVLNDSLSICFVGVPVINNRIAPHLCRTFWARPTFLLERWLDHWEVARKRLLGELDFNQ